MPKIEEKIIEEIVRLGKVLDEQNVPDDNRWVYVKSAEDKQGFIYLWMYDFEVGECGWFPTGKKREDFNRIEDLYKLDTGSGTIITEFDGV